MAAQTCKLTFTFSNPNTPKEFERQLQKILVSKLLNLYKNKGVPGQ